MKTIIILPLYRATKNTVVYRAKDVLSEAIGQVYVRKDALPQVGGEWPKSITLTVEAGE